MSITAPKNTLLYQRKGRPLSLSRKFSDMPVVDASLRMRVYAQANNSGIPKPEEEALWFYLANHAMKELEFRFDPEEPLPAWAVEICDEYHARSSKIAMRAFYYLLLICAREARHNSSKATLRKALEPKYGTPACDALMHYPDHNDLNAVATVFEEKAKGARLGEVTGSIRETFYAGSFSGGYGGPAWGKVTDCLHSFVTGEYTAEMMLDTVWTLCHNNGPIFNKGMLYHCHNAHALQQVLDIQRAGQIPRVMLCPYGTGDVYAEKYVTSEMVEFAWKVSNRMPDGDFKEGRPVDWAEVMALGAVGKYHGLIKKQAPKAPVNPEAPVSDKTHFIIVKNAPGMMFKKLTRAQVKAK